MKIVADSAKAPEDFTAGLLALKRFRSIGDDQEI